MSLAQAVPAESATLNMVQCQIAPNGVTHDDVLSAFLSVDRTAYVPTALAPRALCDDDVTGPDGGLLLLKPLTLALMVQHLARQSGRGAIAVIGDETGYVVDLLRVLGFAALPVMEENALLNGAPWQGVLLNGAVADIPAFLFPYLEEGGCVLAVRQAQGAAMGSVTATTSAKDDLLLGQAGAPPLAAFIKPQEFSL